MATVRKKTQHGTRSRKTLKMRLLVFLGCVVFVFVCLIGRFAYWQLVEGTELQKHAYAMQTRNRNIAPKRGTIYDSTGKILAISATMSKITMNPGMVRDNKLSNGEIAEKLADILDMDEETIEGYIEKDTSYIVVKRRIDSETAQKVIDWCDENDVSGIYEDEDTKRYYPNNNLASHIIGFTGYDDQGLSGLELMLNTELTGTGGRIMNALDASNNELPFTDEKKIEAEQGHNLTLTINESIQYFAEQALKKAVIANKCKNGGCVVVTRPKTGEILAMASYPDFDLNAPWAAPNVAGVNKKKWQGTTTEDVETLNKTVWRNKCVSDTYEPGSTFKAITACAALEEGIVEENTTVTDAPVTVLGARINCWKTSGLHGSESFREAVYNSCNPVFVKAALKMGVPKFYSYVKAFGIGEKTGVTLPAEGVNEIHKEPTELDMSTASFGQRFTVTPLQMAMAYGAIANGGTLMEPLLVSKITDDEGNTLKTYEPKAVRNVISKQTSETMCSILEGVVSEGTGRNAYIPGYRVAGKTGTSETTETKTKNRYIASFASFAPADDAEICVLVVLDHATGELGHGGGAIAAPVAKSIIEDSLTYLEVEREYTSKDNGLQEETITVPDVVGKTIQEAETLLKGSKYELNVKYESGADKSAIVTEQLPKAGMKITKKSNILLYTSNDQHTQH